jgi:hypothetical protein
MINKLQKQFKYTSKANIILTYSNSNNKHGICGHLFEVIDYWEILRKFFTVEILISEDIKETDLDIALTKYKTELIPQIKEAIKFERPRSYNAKNSILIFTDGLLDTKLIYNVKNIILFPCGKKDYSYLRNFASKDKVIIMPDNRLQYGIPPYLTNLHYIKKINFDILKIYNAQCIDNFIYATNNCRLLSNNIIKNYLNITKKENRNLYILVNEDSPLLLNKIEDENLIYEVLPIKDIFSRFAKFIYTGIPRKWDCSNRLLAECKFQYIDIWIDEEINNEYLSSDLGLKYRLQDIKHNFKSLYLKENDPLIEILTYLVSDKSIHEYINKKYIEDFNEIDKALEG